MLIIKHFAVSLVLIKDLQDRLLQPHLSLWDSWIELEQSNGSK